MLIIKKQQNYPVVSLTCPTPKRRSPFNRFSPLILITILIWNFDKIPFSLDRVIRIKLDNDTFHKNSFKAGPFSSSIIHIFYYLLSRVQPGSPFGLPAPYPPPGAFTRPLPDSWGLPDSHRSKKSTENHSICVKKSKKGPNFLPQWEQWKVITLLCKL